jgi:hypothetical protein
MYTRISISAGLYSSLCLNLFNLFNCQKRQLDTWTVVGPSAVKFKPNVHPMPGFSLDFRDLE